MHSCYHGQIPNFSSVLKINFFEIITLVSQHPAAEEQNIIRFWEKILRSATEGLYCSETSRWSTLMSYLTSGISGYPKMILHISGYPNAVGYSNQYLGGPC